MRDTGATRILRVQMECQSFQGMDGHTYDLRRRPVLQRAMRALLKLRLERPGACIDTESLIEVTWAGEWISRNAAKNRAYVTISTLRRAGLGAQLQSTESGYRLDPVVPVALTR